MNNAREHLERLNAYVAQEFPYPAERFTGRGIVICAGGERYFTNAYVAARTLRMLGCNLPIEFWHLGAGEMSDEMRRIVEPLGVRTVDALEVRKQHPARRLNGWELKPYSILHCSFRDVLLLDADNVAIRNPEDLFESTEFAEFGAIFWPDYGRLGASRLIWTATGVAFRNEPEFESGQIVVDKSKCWKALNIAMFLNEWSDYYYRHIHGDKETFHLAWRKIDQAYAMPKKAIRSLEGCVMVQHDFNGQPLFQHRNMRKWTLRDVNTPVKGFKHEPECRRFLEELCAAWSLVPKNGDSKIERELFEVVIKQKCYLYVRVGYDWRVMEFLASNRIGEGAAAMEKKWFIGKQDGRPIIRILGDSESTCELSCDDTGTFRGQWLRFEKMPILLIPVRHP